MTDRLTPQREAEIRKHIAELIYPTYGQRDTERTLAIADAVMPAVRAGVAAELAAVRAERDRYRLAWQSARERAEAYGEGIVRHVADRDTWKRWLKEAEVRVAELERPAVEAHRNEIRQSFAELAATARETRDYEGAFNVECDLREREEQWKREDEEATS